MRRIAKRVLEWMLALVVRDDGSKVVYYHDIGTNYTKMGTPFDLFQAHLACARKKGFQFVSSVGELTGKRKLLLCFDDGFRGLWDVRDFLVKEHLQPTVFLAVELIGQPGYLTWNEILELKRLGFNFQSHTWSHRSLTEVPVEDLTHELDDARKFLSEHLGNEVDQLCFPRGLFSPRILAACEKAGYHDLFMSIPGRLGWNFGGRVGGCSCQLVPRMLCQSASLGEFTSLLHGAMACFSGHYLNLHFVRQDR